MSGDVTLARRSRPQNYPKCSIIEVFSWGVLSCMRINARRFFLRRFPPFGVVASSLATSGHVNNKGNDAKGNDARVPTTSRDFSLLRAREVARTVSRRSISWKRKKTFKWHLWERCLKGMSRRVASHRVTLRDICIFSRVESQGRKGEASDRRARIRMSGTGIGDVSKNYSPAIIEINNTRGLSIRT